MSKTLKVILENIEENKKTRIQLKKPKRKITFKRDEKGVLWSYDADTGERIGRIYEHGEDPEIDTIEEM